MIEEKDYKKEHHTTLGEAKKRFEEDNLFYYLDVKDNDRGIVCKNADTAIYPYRFEKFNYIV